MRIQTKIASAVFLVIAVVNVVYAVYVIRRERGQELEQLQLTMAENDKLLQTVTSGPLYDGNAEQLNAILDTIFTNQDIIRIELTESVGDIKISRSRLPVNPRGKSLERRAVIMWGTDQLGQIETTYSTARIEQLFSVSIRNLSSFALAMLLILSIVIYLVVRGISHPIERLTQSAQDMADGHWDRAISAKGGQELQSLGRSFNRMRQAIRDKIEDLAAQNAMLQRTQFAIDRAKDAIFWVRSDGHFAYVNQAACKSLGYTRQQLLALTVFKIDPQFSEDRWTRHWEETRRQKSHSMESIHRTINGKTYPVELSIDFMSFEDEEYICAFARDISERKQSEERIVQLNRVYALRSNVNRVIVRMRDRQTLLDEVCRIAVEDGQFRTAWIGLMDEETQRISVAASYGLMNGDLDDLNISGTKASEGPAQAVIYAGTYRICNDIEQSEPSAFWRDLARRHGCQSSASFPLTVFDKTVGALNIYSGARSFFEAQEVELLKELAGDISFAFEFLEHEKEQQKLISILEASDDFIGMADLEGHVMYVNSAGMKLVGLESFDDVLKQHIIDYILEKDREKFVTEILPSIRQSSWAGEMQFHHFQTGGSVPVEMNAFVIKNPKTDQPIALATVSRDISERLRAQEEKLQLEAQLMQAQKIESIGTLAGGVAHEINNPINGIMNYAQLMLDRFDQEDPLKAYAKEILSETERVATIVRNLLTFARRDKQAHSPAYLSDIVSAVLSLVQTVMRHDQIDLQVDIPEDLPKFKCRSQQIQQVIMNLATNARDALNERYPGYSPEKILRIAARLMDKHGKKYIRTTIEDKGMGIPVDIRDRIFDPFYTTKPKETGTGLGLSISYGIVKNHHGTLSVESKTGQYTRFHMDLPVNNGWTLA